MRVFGSTCWYVIPHSQVKKLDARSNKAIMVGYAARSKAYKLWDEARSKFVISCDVRFDEEGDDTSHLIAEEAPKIQKELSDCDDEDDIGYEPPDQESSDDTHTPAVPLRRSTRVSRPPERWGISPAFNAQYTLDSALAARVVPTSYKQATSAANIEFWGPVIAREEDAIARK
eukprot:IDg21247t1